MAALAECKAAPAPGGGAVRCWRTDATKAKDKWGDEVKVTQAKKDVDTFPFPMAVTRTIQRPEAAKMWEIWELKVKLMFMAKPAPGAEPDLTVEAATDGVLPQEVAVAMQATILARWNKERQRAARASVKAVVEATPASLYHFAFVETLTWCEENYVEILSVLPPFVNRFITEGAHGNEWHYCILEPKIPPPSVAPLTPEEEEAAAEAEAKRVEEQLEQMRLLEIARKEYAEERRAAAELEGPKPRQLSKKELEEAKKDKQGCRLAKTGSRRTKHDAEAEAQREKEEAKKKAEKKKAREDAAKAGGAVV